MKEKADDVNCDNNGGDQREWSPDHEGHRTGYGCEDELEYRAEEQQCQYYQSGNEVDDEQRELSDGAKDGDEESDGVECEVEQQVPGN